MDTYDKISSELKEYFSSHSVFKILLPLDVIIMFGATGIIILDHFIDFGGLIFMLVYYIRLLGYLLTYANRKDQLLAGGLFLYAANELYVLIHGMLGHYFYFSWSALIDLLLYAFIGYLILKRSYKQK